MIKILKILLIILAIAVLCVAPALAGTCTIRGTVTDDDGTPVPGAKVTLFDANRAEVAAVETDSGGNFAFSDARVATDYCAVRVTYSDGSKTYNNAAYLLWTSYPATGDQSIPRDDTRLETLQLSASPSVPRPSPAPGLSAVVAAIALLAVTASKKHI